GRAGRSGAPGWCRRSLSCSSIRPPKSSNGDRGFLRPDLPTSEELEDLLPGRGDVARGGAACHRLVGALVAVARPEAERPDEGLDARPNGGVRDAELPLHVAQVAPRPEEALEQHQLLLRQAPEAPDAELALQRRAAGAAVETRHGKLAGADRARGDHVVRHAVPFVCATTLAYRLSLCQVSVSICRIRLLHRASTATPGNDDLSQTSA